MSLKAAARQDLNAVKKLNRVIKTVLGMYPAIKNYCHALESEYASIPDGRKKTLSKISEYISSKIAKNEEVRLLYVCTHNSRRSHFGQIWAKVASEYYGVSQINTFSGGTEATAFNTNAINTLVRIGFKINALNDQYNKLYQVWYDDKEKPLECFSKEYNHALNPESNFAAIMTCGEAEENCPFIPGVDLRIATTYEDPKLFENTDLRDLKYDERCKQIALETLYVFSTLNKNS